MFKGTLVALITPFTAQNEIDYGALRTLIEWHIASGTDAIVLCGTTGEAPTLTREEQISIFREGVAAADKRIPIIAGTGTYNTSDTIEMTRAAKAEGVDAALVVVPYYSRPTPEGCFQHYRAIAEVELPMIVYHHPGRAGIKLPVESLLQIAELNLVAAIKESTGDLDYATELIQRSPVPVLTGDDPLVLPTMAVGGVGVVSVVANLIPQEWKQLTALLLDERWKEARELFGRFYPLVKTMFLETNPQCVKYAMSLLGKCSAQMRLPLVQPKDEVKRQIASELSKSCLVSVTN
jgi:4-hydroxy-tetrahydrodipicolinate synthase